MAQQKETIILEYLDGLKQSSKVDDVLIRMRSPKDIDIIITVPEDKKKITEIMLESSMYTHPELRMEVDIINKRRDKLLILTKGKITYEIGVESSKQTE